MCTSLDVSATQQERAGSDRCRLLAIEQQLMQIDCQAKQRQQLEAQIADLDSEHGNLSSALKQLRGGNEPLKQEHVRVERELRSLDTAHEKEDSTARQKVCLDGALVALPTAEKVAIVLRGAVIHIHTA